MGRIPGDPAFVADDPGGHLRQIPNGDLFSRAGVDDAGSALLHEHQKINCKLGDGIINMPEIKKAADAQGVQAYIVEREYAYTGDNFTTILADREYLSKI